MAQSGSSAGRIVNEPGSVPAGAAVSDSDLELLVSIIPFFLARIALDGTILWASAGARELYGREPADLVGTQALDLVAPVDLAEATRRLGHLGEEGMQERMTVRVSRPDETEVWADTWGATLRDRATGELFIVVAAREATEVIQKQAALARVEGRFRELVEWLPAVVYEADPGPAGRFYYVSPQIEDMLGFPVSEWLADPDMWFSRIRPEDRDWVAEMERTQEAESRGTRARMTSEYQMVHRSGRPVWVRDIARVSETQDGRPIWRGVLIDISAERVAQESLASAHEHHRAMVDSLPACVYRAEVGLLGRWDYVSSQIEPLLGYSSAEWMADPTLWRASLHADDRARMEANEKALSRREPGGEFVAEYRMRDRAGHALWVRDRATLSESDDGRLMLQGILTDISAERAAEAGVGSQTDVYRVSCGDCGAIWATDRIEPCRECASENVEGVSLNAALSDLAAARRQVEGLLDGIHKHLDALGTNLRSGRAQLSADTDR